jgi:serine/threonine protein kinase/tetratricopeptide (TPR) repeat protein
LELGDPTARQAFLDEACAGQPELRVRVEALLRAHAGQYGEGRATTGFTPTPPESVGRRVGPYKLLQKLGEGGMGIVYLAEQEQPVKRRVAVKIIKAGMDSAHVLARFEQERQALAMMDHPHIAKVLDAGATPEGRPFFVMELVKGVPITKFCDQEHLTPKDRLELFIPVCQAVQHAHQKGIIHRDLKPSNVLVALYDGKPVPKVIDFGVAKSTGPKLTERTMFTEVGQIVGTLEYMAPEQAELNNLDIDTRADIYALGSILYELLTGSTPFSEKQLRIAGFAEMMRILREVEPPRPSTKLSSSADLPSIAAQRKSEPKRLTRLVHGDIDWIVMKCLEKDRARRYETANALAMDVQRFLDDEPVLAGPPSATYRLRKFVSKNRGILATVGAFALVLVATTAFSAWQAYRAGVAESVARQSEAEALAERNAANVARDAESAARRNVDAQRLRAEANFKKARQAVDEYFTKVSESKLLNVPGLQPLRKDLLDSALRYYKDFVGQHADDPALRAALGAASYRVAVITSMVGTADEARPAMEQARAVYLALTREHPSVVKYWVDLAICDNDLGRHYHAVNDRALASRYHREALKIRERLAREHPDEGRFQDELCRSYANLALIALDEGRTAESLRLTEQGVALLERTVQGADPATKLELPTDLGTAYNSVGVVRIALAGHYERMGYLLRRSGRAGDALGSYRKALEIVESLLAADPENLIYQGAYASTGVTVCAMLDFMGRADESRTTARKVQPVVERLIARNPSVSGYKNALARLLDLQGTQAYQAGRAGEAVPRLKEALALYERLGAENPRVAYYQNRIAAVCRHLGLIPPPHVPQAEGLDLLRRAESLLQNLSNPDTVTVYDLACTQALIAGRHGRGGAAEERVRYEQKAMDTLCRAVAAGYKDLDNIRIDTDLDPLRHRDDFRALIEQVRTDVSGKTKKKL